MRADFTPMMPPRAIVASVSFTESSRVALVLAARLARHCGAELHVLHVEDPLLDVAARHEGIDLAAETFAELRRFVAGAWPAADCLTETHVRAGTAVEVILDVAHRHRADLVVVSSAERRVFGSMTERLLRRADVSVLVAPAEWTPPHPDAPDLSDLGPLVVVVDPSDPRSVPATNAAGELAAVLGTSVEIVDLVPERDASGTGAVAHRLVEAAGATANRAPMLVLGKTAPSTTGGWPGAIVNRVLSGGTVPILMYVAEQIAQM